MSIILGFGQHHVDESRRIVEQLAERVRGLKDRASVQREVDAFRDELGTFKHFGWHFISAWTSVFSDYDEHVGVVIEGRVSHYRDDHPMSPDGIAMFDTPFCLTMQDDPNMGARHYVSIAA
jgi:hypothetical protein